MLSDRSSQRGRRPRRIVAARTRTRWRPIDRRCPCFTWRSTRPRRSRERVVRISGESAGVPSLCSSWRSDSRQWGSRDHRGLCDRHNPGSMFVATPVRCGPRTRADLPSVRTRASGRSPSSRLVGTSADEGRWTAARASKSWLVCGAGSSVAPCRDRRLPDRRPRAAISRRRRACWSSSLVEL